MIIVLLLLMVTALYYVLKAFKLVYVSESIEELDTSLLLRYLLVAGFCLIIIGKIDTGSF